MGTIESGCQGIGVMVVKSGKFAGGDMSGAKIAYATAPGKWVRAYVDAPDAAKTQAASAFAASALVGFGKVEFVKPAHVSVSGSNGSYTFTIQLQASRNGNDTDGRQYTITVSAQDNAGNKGSASTIVTVPHDQGQ